MSDDRYEKLRDELSRPDPTLPNVVGNEANKERPKLEHEPDDEPAGPSPFDKYRATKEVVKERTLPNGVVYKKYGPINIGKVPSEQLAADLDSWEKAADKDYDGEYRNALEFVRDKYGDDWRATVQPLIIERALQAEVSPASVLYQFAQDEGFETAMEQAIRELREED